MFEDAEFFMPVGSAIDVSAIDGSSGQMSQRKMETRRDGSVVGSNSSTSNSFWVHIVLPFSK